MAKGKVVWHRMADAPKLPAKLVFVDYGGEVYSGEVTDTYDFRGWKTESAKAWAYMGDLVPDWACEEWEVRMCAECAHRYRDLNGTPLCMVGKRVDRRSEQAACRQFTKDNS